MRKIYNYGQISITINRHEQENRYEQKQQILKHRYRDIFLQQVYRSVCSTIRINCRKLLKTQKFIVISDSHFNQNSPRSSEVSGIIFHSFSLTKKQKKRQTEIIKTCHCKRSEYLKYFILRNKIHDDILYCWESVNENPCFVNIVNGNHSSLS